MIHRGSHEVMTIGQNLSFVFLMSLAGDDLCGGIDIGKC